ncbi:MAG TPA: flagellar basal body P-ring formation chaperone FlgA [Candidatus Aquilonibacter sp.]|nr:flagellar basal body P-ring formation chaperone FlgA [Candidatus Aquilonibacter sp.]
MRAIAAAAVVTVLAFIGCGPVAACAQSATQHVSGARVEALAKTATRSFSLTRDQELVQAYPIPDQIVPAGHVALVVGTPLVNVSYINVPVAIDLDGKFLRQVFVGYKIQQFVHTAVAAHDLVPGTVLSEDDVKMARIPFTGQRVNGVDALVGRRVLGAIRAGQPIAIESTQTNQIVKPGSTVVLIVHDGGVSVVADVVARTGGGLGEEIQMWNPQTRKSLSGTVIGPDRVELDLSGGAL